MPPLIPGIRQLATAVCVCLTFAALSGAAPVYAQASELVLIAEKDPEIGDMGDFNRIRLVLSDATIGEHSNEDGWSYFADDMDEPALRVTHGGGDFVLLRGHQYGCCPRQVTILQVTEIGVVVVYEDEFELVSWQYNPTVGLEVIGRHCLDEIVEESASDHVVTTYCPFIAYRVGDQMLLDRDRTREYNEAEYAGYRGSEASADIHVIHFRDGRSPQFQN